MPIRIHVVSLGGLVNQVAAINIYIPLGCDLWVKDYTGESKEDQSQNSVELLGRKSYFSAMFTRSKENITPMILLMTTIWRLWRSRLHRRNQNPNKEKELHLTASFVTRFSHF